MRPIEALVPYARNARTHSAAQIASIAASIIEFGWTNPILADATGIIAGHGRVLAARDLLAQGRTIYHVPGQRSGGSALPPGMLPVVDCTGWTEPQRRAYIIADNAIALDAGWDDALLKIELEDLKGADFDLGLLGFADADLQGFLSDTPPAGGKGDGPSLADRFLVPPFTVLNAREGWWQERKAQWIGLGIKSELGRGVNTLDMSEAMAGITDPAEIEAWNAGRRTQDKARLAPGGGGTGGWIGGPDRPAGAAWTPASAGRAEVFGTEGNISDATGTSIFDPVLCELAYRWFCPLGGHVLDPFAGGSVRGIVAAVLGRSYTGIDLSRGQLDANIEQAAEMDHLLLGAIEWRHGDSRTADLADVDADLVFTCPPYADLEVYSDHPADISAMPYADFMAAYREIIARSCARLRENRFAVVVVGEVRDERGRYRNFIGDTVEAFRAAGLAFYNEAILVTAVGSLPIRVGKQFTATRKLGKTHQQVLVFLKGDPKAATAACGVVDVSDALAGEPAA
jgi:hypothetical protein